MPSTPTGLLLQHLALRLLLESPACKTLEIGVGEGDFFVTLAGRGYWGKGVDLSLEAVTTTRAKIRKTQTSQPVVVEQLDFRTLFEEFQLVIAFEVFEHLEDDVAGMKKVRDLMLPGGHFLLSVPAHKARFGGTDEIAGHLRRYEREELKDKLTLAGFTIKQLWSYGYPLSNWLKPLRDVLNSRKLASCASAPTERTRDSGVARVVGAPDAVYRLLFNPVTLLPFYLWQDRYLDSDLGDGYVVLARRAG